MNCQGWWLGSALTLGLLSFGCRQPEKQLVLSPAVKRLPSLTAEPLPKAAGPSQSHFDAAAAAAAAAAEGGSPVPDDSAPTRLVSWQSASDVPAARESEALPVPPTDAAKLPPPLPDLDLETGQPLESGAETVDVPPLSVDDVLASVVNHYPLLQVALRERQITSGKEVASLGQFDTGFKGYSLAEPLGFYKNYRSLMLIDQPLTNNGGKVIGGYKLGHGSFQPWYGERETNEGGELALGFEYSLWQNRAIDKRRAAYYQARLERLAADPAIQSQWLGFSQAAAETYWAWVASGLSYQAQQRLLDLALERSAQIAERIRRGDLAEIADIDNQRFIAARETKLIERQRKFQQSAIKLSLFLRADDGTPYVPGIERSPDDFPEIRPVKREQFNADVEVALAARPELAELDFQIRGALVELNQARNLVQPKLDATFLAAKDVGRPASSKGDKTPFQLEAGVLAEVPLQRREARGKMRRGRQAGAVEGEARIRGQQDGGRRRRRLFRLDRGLRGSRTGVD